MTEKQKRVNVSSKVFPGYDATLDSKVQRPDQYGITYTDKALRILGAKKHSSWLREVAMAIKKSRPSAGTDEAAREK